MYRFQSGQDEWLDSKFWNLNLSNVANYYPLFFVGFIFLFGTPLGVDRTYDMLFHIGERYVYKYAILWS